MGGEINRKERKTRGGWAGVEWDGVRVGGGARDRKKKNERENKRDNVR